MTGQLQFNGMVPFIDRNTGSMVNVQVWGVFVGVGIDAHETSAIQHWILSALATSAQSYSGSLEELPAQAAQWGNYVSSQLSPQLAEQFQAQGQLHIQGVAMTPQAPQSAPMAQAPLQDANVGAGLPSMGQVGGALGGAAGMLGGALGAVGGVVGALAGAVTHGPGAQPGGSAQQVAISRLTSQLGLPPHTAQQAVAVVMEVLQSHGMLGAAAHAVSHSHPATAHDQAQKQALLQQQQMQQKQAQQKQVEAKQAEMKHAHDPYAKKPEPQKHDPYAKKPEPQKHDPYAKKLEPQKQDFQKGAPPQKQDFQKGAPPQKHDPYAKGPPKK